MKNILYFLALFILHLSARANGCTLVFETQEVLIKVDTGSFFKIIDKEFSHKRASEIRNEIRFRINAYGSNEVKMDGINLNIYNDTTRRSYTAACLYGSEVFELIDHKNAKIYYKSNSKEITHIKIKKTGSKRSGLIEEVYIDCDSGNAFLKRTVYRLSCGGPPNFKNNKNSMGL